MLSSPIVDYNLFTNKKLKWLFLVMFTFAIFSILLWDHIRGVDDPNYFNFADQRMFWGVPNFFDVLSNLPFLLVGLWTFWSLFQDYNLFCFKFFGLMLGLGGILTFLGSSYFHWAPSSGPLFWDRWPIVLSFCAALGLVVSDRFSEKLGRAFFILLFSLSTYFLWQWKWGLGDLRPYFVLQYGGLIIILLLSLLFSAHKIKNRYLFISLGLYVLAKLTEIWDQAIFQVLAGNLSGHSIKHMLAAGALYSLILSLRSNMAKSLAENYR